MTTFQTLLNETKPGLHHLHLRAPAAELCSAAGAAGWQCYTVDGAPIGDKAAFLAAFAAALHFPAYFGHNWDAFEECLNDLSWEDKPEAKGLAILIDAAGPFAKANPADWAIACDIFKSATKAHKKAGRRMLIFVRGIAVQD
ncbi:MAG TPA: barstar family protein [Anaerolineae bacterium]